MIWEQKLKKLAGVLFIIILTFWSNFALANDLKKVAGETKYAADFCIRLLETGQFSADELAAKGYKKAGLASDADIRGGTGLPGAYRKRIGQRILEIIPKVYKNKKRKNGDSCHFNVAFYPTEPMPREILDSEQFVFDTFVSVATAQGFAQRSNNKAGSKRREYLVKNDVTAAIGQKVKISDLGRFLFNIVYRKN